MSPSIVDAFEPASPDAVTAFERQLGVSLPDDYRTHLLQHNGGRPEPEYFDVTWPARCAPAVTRWTVGGVHYLFDIGGDEPATDLVRNAILYRDRVPDDTIAIATDRGGNPILLGIAGENRGRVFFHLWREGSHDQAGPADIWDNVGDVAPSFSEFLAGLHPERR